MRVVSLVPAGTEMLTALGRETLLVGISYECPQPPGLDLPRVTRSALPPPAGRSQGEIDRLVAESLAAGRPLYAVDEPLLRRLRPDVLLTQSTCDACAVGHAGVAALARGLPGRPKVVDLDAARLLDVLENIEAVGEAVGEAARAASLAGALSRRLLDLAVAEPALPRLPVVVVLEWLDPPYQAGHWVPDMVRLAGGTVPLALPGRRSHPIPWQAVVAAAPEVLVFACCGLDATRARQDAGRLRDLPGYAALPAVAAGAVFAVDGDLFTCPGPRLVEGVELLFALLRPDAPRPPLGWVRCP